MNKVALLRLADKLEGKGPYEDVGPIKRRRLDMNFWAKSKNIKIGRPVCKGSEMYKVEEDLICGTAACAAGWAGSDPWFRKRGLYLVSYDGIETGMYYKGETDFTALMLFFDIAYVEGTQLFGGQLSRTPKQVAQQIRRFVEWKSC